MTAPTTPANLGDDRGPLPLRFGPDGLIPAVIQDAETNAVLMVGFMNAEALALTRSTGRVHFWSRSRAKLWRKGETSGHEQLVEDIYVNCEQNSLLLTIHQIGAACHDGYATCYYRRLEPDNRLVVTQDLVFDPAQVYGANTDRKLNHAPESADRLTQACRTQFDAYRFLRDHDLGSNSGTSARLRAVTDDVSVRIGDELKELAGALDGSHRHRDLAADVRLEGGQVLYWSILAALRAGATWEALRPDRALQTTEPDLSTAATVALLRAEADRWSAPAPGSDIVAACHATIALVGQACLIGGVKVADLVADDLTALRSKPYLAAYFAALGG